MFRRGKSKCLFNTWSAVSETTMEPENARFSRHSVVRPAGRFCATCSADRSDLCFDKPQRMDKSAAYLILISKELLHQVSFLHTFVPFLKLVTSPLILAAALQNYVNTFLQALGQSFQWAELHPVLEELLPVEEPRSGLGSLLSFLSFSSNSSTQQSSGSEIDNWMDIVYPFVFFLLELLRRFDDRFLREIAELRPYIERMMRRVPIDFCHPDRQHRQFAQHIIDFSKQAFYRSNLLLI